MNTYLYVLSCPLGLVKVGVAADPKQRLRNLQIGSPVPLELAAQYAISDRPSAEAVEAALQERFRDRRERGHWFRATPTEVRRAITERSIIDLYRPSEAGERAAAREAAEAAEAEAAKALASATAAERRRLRRERRTAAAEMLGAGMTQIAAAAALGVTDRTIRNWAKAKSFQTTLRRARERAARQAAAEAAKERSRRDRNARRRFRRQNPALWADLQARRPELRSPFQQQPAREAEQQPSEQARTRKTASPSPPSATAAPRRASGGRILRPARPQSYAGPVGEGDARVPAPPDRRVRLVTESGKTIASTAESNAERMAAALEPRHGPLTIVPA
jgi:transposase